MSRPTRIAFLSEHASPVARLGGVDAGGQNVYIDELSRHLAARGYRIDIFTRRDDPSLPEIIEWAQGIRIVNITAGPPAWCSKDELWSYMPTFRNEIVRLIECKHWHYDVIHSNFWMSGWVGCELAQHLDIPVVQIFHALGQTKHRYQQHDDTSPSERITVEMNVVHQANRIIAQCPSERHELLEDYLADPQKVVTIPAAANIHTFRPVSSLEARQLLGISANEFVMVYVGRMLPRKDVRNIVQALAHLRHAYDCRNQQISLLVVGGETEEPDPLATPEIGELQRLANELGVSEQVRFIGKRQPESLRYYYGASDVVITTPWYEPFGLTPLEAMACGRPVIGSAVGGLTFTIQDGKTGFLVPPRDPVSLAERCYHLLQHPLEKEQMGRAARLRVEQAFSWPIAAERMDMLYTSLLSKKASVEPVLAASACEPFFLPFSSTRFDSFPVGGGE